MFVTKHLDAVLQGGDWTSCLKSSVPHRHKRDWKKTNHNPSVLAPYWGLPSQYLSILLVRSYRTFAPLPDSIINYQLSIISCCCSLFIVYCSLNLAVFFCGTLLAIARTGNYPASMVFWESGLSSNLPPRTNLQPPR